MYIRVITVILLCVCVRALVFDTEAEWSEWFSRDDERGSGDWEKLSDLHAAFPDRLCLSPLDIQVSLVTQLNSENFIYNCGAIKNQKPIEKLKKKIKNQTHTCDWAMLAASISFSEQNEHNEFIGWKISQ